jgi:hypothetical protein
VREADKAAVDANATLVVAYVGVLDVIVTLSTPSEVEEANVYPVLVTRYKV